MMLHMPAAWRTWRPLGVRRQVVEFSGVAGQRLAARGEIAMDEAKRKALEAAGFRVGDAEDFLGLDTPRKVDDPIGKPIYIDDYPTCAKTYVTLRIYPEKLDPTQVTEQLRIEPSSWQRKGDVRNPGGKVPRTYSLNGWFLSSEGALVSRDVRRHLDWLLGQIGAQADALLALQGEGCQMDVFCYWLSRSCGGGPTISPRQMAELARLHLELAFDVYFAQGDSQL
jgi:hypothetical protein